MRRIFAAVLIFWLLSCAEPDCPSGYMQFGGTCRRCKPGEAWFNGKCWVTGDAGEPILVSDPDAGLDDEDDLREAEAGIRAPEGGADPTVLRDASVDIDIDAIVAGGGVLDAARQPDEGGPREAAAMVDGDIDVCTPSSCQRGGTCTEGPNGVTCTCPSGSTGARCELEVCGETTILSRAGLEAAKLCAEVHGNLNISSTGVASITANDLPHLRRVSGDVVIGPQAGSERTPLLETITLARLERVEGMLFVGGNLPGSVRELYLPALTSVGTVEDATPRLRLLQTESAVLAFPVLSTINGGVEIRDLPYLCTLKLAALSRVSGGAFLYNLPNVPAAALQPIRDAVIGAVMQKFIGCCSFDTVDCSEYPAQSREIYCGC